MNAYFRQTLTALVCAALLAMDADAGVAAAPATALDARLHLAPCVVGRAKTPARCGTFDVFEDRVAQSGRTIPLKLVVVGAKNPSGRAMFWNPGGPGISAVNSAPGIVDGEFEKPMGELRDRYDLVFVDVRGTGGSAPLQCDLYVTDNPAPYFAQLWPDAALRACRAASAQRANLDLYTTDVTADDLEDVRAALHAEHVVLNGDSYGTMLYLDYLRRHPEHVESVVLNGVAPPGILIIPLEGARRAQLALDRLIVACAADRMCHVHFPAFAAHVAALERRFDRGPLRVPVAWPKSLGTVSLSKEVFAFWLRQMMDTGPAESVPFVLEQAYRGNYVPLGVMIQAGARGMGDAVAIGLNLSVTCAEDIPFITEADVTRTSARTFMGDTGVRAQLRACAIWNVHPVSRAFIAPVRSNAPILMISGADDATSPAEFGREALRYLPNARQIVIRNASRGTELPCADRLIVEFVRARSAKNLHTAACAASYHRPPFRTSWPR